MLFCYPLEGIHALAHGAFIVRIGLLLTPDQRAAGPKKSRKLETRPPADAANRCEPCRNPLTLGQTLQLQSEVEIWVQPQPLSLCRAGRRSVRGKNAATASRPVLPCELLLKRFPAWLLSAASRRPFQSSCSRSDAPQGLTRHPPPTSRPLSEGAAEAT